MRIQDYIFPTALMFSYGCSPTIETPDFNLHYLENGTEITLQEYFNDREQRKEPLLISTWGIWCGPCREEIPILNDLMDKVDILGVLDGTDQVQETVEIYAPILEAIYEDAHFANRFALAPEFARFQVDNIRSLEYTGDIQEDYEIRKEALGIISVPAFLLLDGEGDTVLTIEGALYAGDNLEGLLNKLDELD